MCVPIDEGLCVHASTRQGCTTSIKTRGAKVELADFVQKIGAPIIQAISVCITAVFASIGLNAWRRQVVGKRALEIAEETLLATYKVRGVIRQARRPTLGAGATRPKPEQPEEQRVAEDRNMYYATIETLRKNVDTFAKFEQCCELCIVYFGERARKPFRQIYECIWSMESAVSVLMRDAGLTARTPQHVEELERRHRENGAVVWEAEDGKPDPIRRKVNAAVTEIEAMCAPHVRIDTRNTVPWSLAMARARRLRRLVARRILRARRSKSVRELWRIR